MVTRAETPAGRCRLNAEGIPQAALGRFSQFERDSADRWAEISIGEAIAVVAAMHAEMRTADGAPTFGKQAALIEALWSHVTAHLLLPPASHIDDRYTPALLQRTAPPTIRTCVEMKRWTSVTYYDHEKTQQMLDTPAPKRRAQKRSSGPFQPGFDALRHSHGSGELTRVNSPLFSLPLVSAHPNLRRRIQCDEGNATQRKGTPPTNERSTTRERTERRTRMPHGSTSRNANNERSTRTPPTNDDATPCRHVPGLLPKRRRRGPLPPLPFMQSARLLASGSANDVHRWDPAFRGSVCGTPVSYAQGVELPCEFAFHGACAAAAARRLVDVDHTRGTIDHARSAQYVPAAPAAHALRMPIGVSHRVRGCCSSTVL
ncbi:hypothetical protein C8R43DRAFT_1129791 [Mycena crocata]|nr:hypothetical protein C8R43DRAFT_1129791 [Mycena crocata]